MIPEVRVEREIAAPLEVVFDAFTSAGGQEALYGQDDPGWIVETACELRVGGAWTITFGPSRSHLYRHRHVFEAIERPHRLLVATTEHRPDGRRLDFGTEFLFAARDGSTLLTMIQTGLKTAELREEHGRGVPNALARLDRAIKTGVRR
ncbi:MAG TPA: SRPBCC domain-containing protein [Solirubrobacteraceae bacterium]|nr:SRPBCC domain-containing protein [Solirubrobacteraceae bacterium]